MRGADSDRHRLVVREQRRTPRDCVVGFAADDGNVGLSSPLTSSLCWAVAPVTLLRLVWLRVLSPAAADRAFSRPAAGGDRPGLRRGQRRRDCPSLARPPAAERNPATGSEPVGARRAAVGPGARRAVDRPSVRSALHRPRGQGVFPRGRPRQQRTSARPGVHHRRHRRSAGLPRLDCRHAWADSPRGTASISSWATTTAASTSAGFAARWNRAGWSTSAAAGCRSRSAARPVLLAGNERPWFDGPADMRATHRPVAAADRACRTPTPCGSCWRTLPINFAWARAHERRPDAGRSHARRADSHSAAGGDLFAHGQRREVHFRRVLRRRRRSCTSPAASPATFPCAGTARRRSPTCGFAPAGAAAPAAAAIMNRTAYWLPVSFSQRARCWSVSSPIASRRA